MGAKCCLPKLCDRTNPSSQRWTEPAAPIHFSALTELEWKYCNFLQLQFTLQNPKTLRAHARLLLCRIVLNDLSTTQFSHSYFSHFTSYSIHHCHNWNSVVYLCAFCRPRETLISANYVWRPMSCSPWSPLRYNGYVRYEQSTSWCISIEKVSPLFSLCLIALFAAESCKCHSHTIYGTLDRVIVS